MLQIFAICLVLLWLAGMATSSTFGGFVHVLLLLAVVSMLIRLLQGRHAL